MVAGIHAQNRLHKISKIQHFESKESMTYNAISVILFEVRNDGLDGTRTRDRACQCPPLSLESSMLRAFSKFWRTLKYRTTYLVAKKVANFLMRHHPQSNNQKDAVSVK